MGRRGGTARSSSRRAGGRRGAEASLRVVVDLREFRSVLPNLLHQARCLEGWVGGEWGEEFVLEGEARGFGQREIGRFGVSLEIFGQGAVIERALRRTTASLVAPPPPASVCLATVLAQLCGSRPPAPVKGMASAAPASFL